MTRRWPIAAIWACCVLRLGFYAAMLPLWEGYDEWAHFSVIRAIAAGEGLLVPRDRPVTKDVQASLLLAPVPWELRAFPWPAVTQDAFWDLPPEERAQRVATFRGIPPAWRFQNGAAGIYAYEALQPPLYYWLMAPALKLASRWSLPAQVMLLRWLAVLIASLTVPLVYGIGKTVLDRESLALGCAAIVTVMPGFALDVARVSNDCLAVVLFTALTWMAIEAFQGRGNALVLGVTLGLGLLTKVYFLTAIVMLAVLVIRRSWRVAAGAFIIAAAIAGWWYGRNIMNTGTLSGLSEAVALRGTGALDMLRKARALPWRTAIDSILFSHLFFGGWSSLKVRSWMYHVFYWFIPFAGMGLIREKQRPEVQALAAIYFAFWVGQLYNVLLIFASKGVPTSMGWYLYAVIGAEVVLCVLGLQQLLPERIQNWAALPGVVLFALLDLYAMHAVSIPYYTGLIRHRPNGALAAVHLADFRAAGFGAIFERLTAFKNLAPAMLIGLWALYAIATLLVVVQIANSARRHPVSPPS